MKPFYAFRSLPSGAPVSFSLWLSLFLLLCGCHKTLTEQTGGPASELATASLTNAASTKLNIVYIMSDEVGYEIPTYNGGQSYSTPNLDFMAANGVQFSNFYSHPDGGPSRLAALTGKYSYQNFYSWGYLPPDQKTFGNMLQNAGYATCFVGKWQLDGGDASLRNGGFNKYLAFLPYQPPKGSSDSDQYYRRYKTPLLYQNGAYLPDSAVKDKYSEDLFYNYAASFIDSNRNKPFLLYYSCNLVQQPWSPTPDDPDYAGWNPETDDVARDDLKYFPGMVAYMDKIVGKLIAKINDEGLASRTVFIFTSDNGTNRKIISQYRGKTVKGAKNYTYRAGINVPLVCYGSPKLMKGVKDTALTDMTDFMPTLAGIAGIPTPTTYGTLDGQTFYDNLVGKNKKDRSWVFCHWIDEFAKSTGRPPLQRYAFDYNYKLYDTAAPNSNFYNIRIDSLEKRPISNDRLTAAERKEKAFLQSVLDSHKKKQ